MGAADRRNTEQELISLYGLTRREATAYVAKQKIGYSATAAYMGIEYQGVRNLIEKANKKIKRAEDMIISIIIPTDRPKEIQFETNILTRFYTRTTGAVGRFGHRSIIIMDDAMETGSADWIQANVFDKIQTDNVTTVSGVYSKVDELCGLFNTLPDNDDKMGYGVLKHKLDEMYVFTEII